MPIVSREEFEVRSELEVVHLPTGAIFRTYPYSDADDMLRSIRVEWGKPGSAARTEDYSEQVLLIASQLLLERARFAMSERSAA